jgi:hypothetical protein
MTFASGFGTSSFYRLLTVPVPAACPAHYTCLDFIFIIIVYEENKL